MVWACEWELELTAVSARLNTLVAVTLAIGL